MNRFVRAQAPLGARRTRAVYRRAAARLVLCALGAIAFGRPVAAQTTAFNVKEIVITGNRSVSDQLIRSQLRVRPGQPYRASDIQRDIRRLFDLGYFSDIKADVRETVDGVIIEYILTERKIIRDVVIVGNRYVNDATLAEVLKAKPGQTYVPGGYQQDQDAIIAVYRGRGFASVNVDVRVREISRTEVELIYTVDEGLKVKVRRIHILGTQAVPERELRRAMRTRPPILRLFGGGYNEDTFRQDLTRILDAFADRGHIDAEIVETRVDYVPGRGNRVDLTIVVSEGPEYVVDQVDLDGNEVYDRGPLLRHTKTVVGDVYNQGQVDAEAEAIQEFYSSHGYILASVASRLDIDREQHTIGVTYSVTERQLMYVGRVLVRGNVKTKDEVIRRELTIHPGDRYDGTKLQTSRERLMRTDYYQEVTVTTEATDVPNQRDLVYLVEEQRTGQFNFGAGFSTNDSLIGQISVQQNNFDITNFPTFTGAGQHITAIAAPGTVLSSYRLSFTEPYLWGNPVSGGFDLFFLEREFSEYDQDTQGATVRLGKRLTDVTSAAVGYTYQIVDISNVDADAPVIIRGEKGETTKSSVSLSYVTDTRDNSRIPTSGARHGGTVEVAGLGGDSEFAKVVQESHWFMPFPLQEDWTLMIRGEVGAAFDYGDNPRVPVFDRFFAGGTGSVRGYDFREVGPRQFGDPIGGELLTDGTFELGIPLFPIVRGYTFFDWGQVWVDPSDFLDPGLKTAAGVGVGLMTPLGPMRFDFGFPLNPDDDQGDGEFHLSTGFAF